MENPKFREWVDVNNKELTQFWQDWIKAHPGSKEAFDEALLILKNSAIGSTKFNDKKKERLWKKIDNSVNSFEATRISDKESKVLPIHPKFERKQPEKQNFGFGKIVATLSILLVASFLLWHLFKSNKAPIPPSTEISTILKSNPPGQRSTIFLPDGSKVVLGSASGISYQSDFQEKHRSIKLTGEAFFDVVKNPQIPFIVTSNDIVTTALGTSFNVKSNPNEQHIEVSLVTGEVLVECLNNERNQERLLPGQQALYNPEIDVLKTGAFDVWSTIGWKDGILIFQKAKHLEVFNRLSSWYGVKFEFENFPIEEWNYTGNFDNESLEHVLKGIGFVNNFKFSISGKNVKIQFK